MQTRHRPWLLVFFSLALALMVNLSAWRSDYLFWKPPMFLLITLYWLLFEPQIFGLLFAFTLGLLNDLMTGMLVGEAAMAFCIIAYCAQAMENRLLHFTVFHQCLLIAGLVALYQLISSAIQVSMYGGSLRSTLFYPVASAFILWPFIVGILGRLHRRAL